jgi:putative solute:sodium symporter small subunit
MNDASPPTAPPGEERFDIHDPRLRESLSRYWRTNIKITLFLLVLWAIAGLVCGILIADRLNTVHLPGTGYPLGFWFAQQGSIIIFVLLILAYCLFMNRLDARHHEELERIRREKGS